MMLLNSLLLALRSIRRNLMRSFLTVLGIVIGVSAVITMVTLGNGATLSVQAQIASLGTNLLQVRPGQRMGPGGSGGAPALLVKIATIGDLKDTPRVKDEVYNGNIVIVDISRLKMDKISYERVLKDLKEVAKDVNGDIIGLGDQRYVVLTPMSVKISRDKIGGA